MKFLPPIVAGLLSVILLDGFIGVHFGTANPQTDQGKIVSPQGDQKTKVKSDRKLEAILEMLPEVSPEFGADISIRLVESNKISDRAMKIDLLKSAFHLAGS